MNIGDIAKMAGVSRAAVSRYLNNGYLSEEKRERIRKVIAETGYKPSIMARTLRTKKTKLIGVVLPRINSDTISAVVEGIANVLGENGYEMLLASTRNSPEKELDYLRLFSEDRVDGIIFLATVFTREHKRLLRSMSVPVVIVGQQLDGFSCVYHDDFHAGRDLADRMLADKRERIGYLGVLKEDIAVGRDRAEGVLRQIRKAQGADAVQERRLTADFSIPSGYEKMKELYEKCPDLDGVICATDSIAVGAMNYLKEQDIRIPDEIAVAGFGDNRISAEITPSLTTVHFYYRESGEKAARKILDHLADPSAAKEQTKLGYEVMVRASTGPKAF